MLESLAIGEHIVMNSAERTHRGDRVDEEDWEMEDTWEGETERLHA